MHTSTSLFHSSVFFLLVLGSASAVQAQPTLELTLLGEHHTGLFDVGAAEIVAYDASNQRLFFVNAEDNQVVALDISDPEAPVEAFSIAMDAYGGGTNSVAVYDGLVAVAVEADTKQDPGEVVFFNVDGDLLAQVTVGALPDALTFTPDGMNVIVANEGEPNDDYTNDPEGSVSVIDLTDGPAGATVVNVTFEDFNDDGPRAGELPDGVRIFGPGATVAQDLEPEYIAVSPEGDKAYATLQENNALAVIDVATASVDAIVALNEKDHSLSDNGIDASDRDDVVNIGNWPVYGLYLPDAISAYAANGQTYLVTANEGDARDYDAFAEEERIKNVTLDPDAFPDAEVLQSDEAIGRLTITTTLGDTDDDGDYDELYTLGTRSFSIWTPDGMLVYDSGDAFEQVLAQELPDDFNANNDENDTFDSRSDNKGPEPEGVALGVIDDHTYAFVGLERTGGIMVYDITDPESPEFVNYANNRDFSILFDPDTVTPEELELVGELGPEGLVFIPASDSPNGEDLLIVSHEVSGSVSIYQVELMATGTEGTADVPDAFSLHGNVPNPFNSTTRVVFDLAAPARVQITVYDVQGKRVLALPAEAIEAGLAQSVSIDARSLAAGNYLYRVTAEADGQTEVRTGQLLVVE